MAIFSKSRLFPQPASEAPPDERGGNRYGRPQAMANDAGETACGRRWDRPATPTPTRCASASSRPSNAAANQLGRPHTTLTTLLWFRLMTMFEDVHPLEGGTFRGKSLRRAEGFEARSLSIPPLSERSRRR